MTLSEHILCSYLISFLLTSVDLNRRRQWHPTPVLLPGKSHGWRILVGFNPWSRWELDMTERLYFHFWLSCIREGNGNPLHCSCLENLRDGGAWWAAIYGVTQSWTWLKWLSNSLAVDLNMRISLNLNVFHELWYYIVPQIWAHCSVLITKSLLWTEIIENMKLQRYCLEIWWCM